MTPDLDVPQRRRTLLRLMGAAAGAGALGRAVAQDTDGESESTDGGSAVVLEQGDRCIELEPISGSTPVEDLYDYTYPTDRFVGPPGSQGASYSSEGTVDLQRDRTSILFAYDGPGGLSLVVVHGHVGGETDRGGTVTFTVDGVPAAAEWVIRDDYYLEDGQQAESNHDRWDTVGSTHVVDWGYRGGRTDGGVLRGLGADFDVGVEPAFNDAAGLASELSFGPIEAWEALSGDRSSPERYPLRLDRPVRLHGGTCGDQTGTDGEGDDGGTETDRSSGETDGDDDPADRRQTKHERKQQKHRKKHQRKQQKHREKHERKQKKHRKGEEREREKHRKKQQKHREKHERKQQKHRKHAEEDDEEEDEEDG